MLKDYHLHTVYSEDVDAESGCSVDILCEESIKNGLSEIAVTDHYDIDGILDGYFRPLDIDNLQCDVLAAKDKFRDRLSVLYGVELGQPLHKLKESDAFINAHPFDFVIGSVHSVVGIIDFYSVDYDNTSDNELIRLFDLYIDELEQTVKWGNFSSLAHITYPNRYYKKHGRAHLIDIDRRGREYFEKTLRLVAEKGLSLEVNTSGLRQNLGCTMPNDDLLLFYKELGGEMITVGSDSHFRKHVGADIARTYSHLKELGFKYTVRYIDKKPITEKL